MIPWNKIKLLIVDMDNTLCDTFHTLSKPQWQHVEKKLKEKGWEEYAAIINENFGKKGFKTTLEESGMSDEQIEYAIKVYDDVDVTPLQLFPDAHAILELDMDKILITRGEPELQKRKIAHLDIEKYFSKVDIVDTFHTKTETIEKIRDESGLDSDEILIIGDRIEEEIADGESLGIPTVLVLRPDRPVAESDVTPDYIVNSLQSIAEKL